MWWDSFRAGILSASLSAMKRPIQTRCAGLPRAGHSFSSTFRMTAGSGGPLPPDVRAAADLPYDFRTDETLYTRFGDWFAWLCVLVSVILVAATFRKAK